MDFSPLEKAPGRFRELRIYNESGKLATFSPVQIPGGPGEDLDVDEDSGHERHEGEARRPANEK